MKKNHLSALSRCLEKRKLTGTLRSLTRTPVDLVDFSSNDYFGLAQCPQLQQEVSREIGCNSVLAQLGSTGSRLLSGNSAYAEKLESMISSYHDGDSALLFNSGFDCNYGLFSSVPQSGDIVIYDSLAHNSIREGVKASRATGIAFDHNCMKSLEYLLESLPNCSRPPSNLPTPSEECATALPCNVFISVESVYSMDGDVAPLRAIVELAQRYQAAVIVDEAHGLGVLGSGGRGLVHHLGLSDDVFATVYTYGKAMGAHGACVVGDTILRDYLLNYSRPSIYSTALPGHSLATISCGYRVLDNHAEKLQQLLRCRIESFRSSFFQEAPTSGLRLLPSTTAVQAVLVPGGNEAVTGLASALRDRGFAVLPIRAPTVPAGKERLRVCLHVHNTESQVRSLAAAIVELSSQFE